MSSRPWTIYAHHRIRNVRVVAPPTIDVANSHLGKLALPISYVFILPLLSCSLSTYSLQVLIQQSLTLTSTNAWLKYSNFTPLSVSGHATCKCLSNSTASTSQGGFKSTSRLEVLRQWKYFGVENVTFHRLACQPTLSRPSQYYTGGQLYTSQSSPMPGDGRLIHEATDWWYAISVRFLYRTSEAWLTPKVPRKFPTAIHSSV